jgi:hypothetical protein
MLRTIITATVVLVQSIAVAGPGAELVGPHHVFLIGDRVWPEPQNSEAFEGPNSLWELEVLDGQPQKSYRCLMLREKYVAVTVYCPKVKGFTLSGAVWVRKDYRIKGHPFDHKMHCVRSCLERVPRVLQWQPN